MSIHRTAVGVAAAIEVALWRKVVTYPLFRRLTSVYVIFSVLTLLVMFGALADIITIIESRVQHLPKLVWIIIVILLPLVGSILWFSVGREYAPSVARSRAPGVRRDDAVSGPHDSGLDLRPRNTEDELAALNREIAAHERGERIRELEAQLEEKRREKGTNG